MIFDGAHFEYGTFVSREFNLVIGHINTSDFTRIAGDIKTEELFSKRNKRRYYIGDDYSGSALSFDAEIVVCNDYALSYQQRRAVEKALFYCNGYKRLYKDMADDMQGESYEIIDGDTYRNYLNCRFTHPERIEKYDGGTVGYKVTVECDSPFLWQDAQTKTFTLNHSSASSTSAILLDVDTDIPDYTYPRVAFEIGNVGGNLSVINLTDDESRITGFKSLTPSLPFTMNGDTNFISDNCYEKFSDRNFIRLLDGENEISVTGNVTEISITWNNRRYL